MKRISILVAATLFITGNVVFVFAQGTEGFSSGSDESYGEILVDATAGTVVLDMPPDGIFNCTTVTVDSGATLKFRRNSLNTPVYLLATGRISISGTIDVSGSGGTSSPPIGGAGGPGGFDGGHPGIGDLPPGAGQGPGGGLGGVSNNQGGSSNSAGSGAYGSVPNKPSASDGSTYGSPLLIPLLGGSGAGGGTGQPGSGGAGGGGAVLLSSDDTVVINGTINARGGLRQNHDNVGSGGGIRLVAPTVSGSGTLEVRGGAWNETGGHGRIRIDTIDTSGIRFTFEPNSALSIGSFMDVFPEPLPWLDLLEVAGRTIEEGATDPVLVFLPFGSTPSRQIVIQARDFTGLVPISIALTPESGDPTIYDATLDMDAGNPAQVSVDVEFPVNTETHVHAWTK